MIVKQIATNLRSVNKNTMYVFCLFTSINEPNFQRKTQSLLFGILFNWLYARWRWWQCKHTITTIRYFWVYGTMCKMTMSFVQYRKKSGYHRRHTQKIMLTAWLNYTNFDNVYYMSLSLRHHQTIISSECMCVAKVVFVPTSID